MDILDTKVEITSIQCYKLDTSLWKKDPHRESMEKEQLNIKQNFLVFAFKWGKVLSHP